MKVLTCCTLCLALVAPAQAEEKERVLGWTDVADLSLVMTSGNSEVESLSVKNVAIKTMEVSQFTVELGALRSESTTRFAVGMPDSFVETEASELTAESYYLRGRYDHQINERLFWFVGGGWNRNTFAGVDNRYFTVVGVGHVWFDTETSRLRTDYGASFTRQEDVNGLEKDFVGLSLSWDYWRQLNGSTDLGSALLLDPNLDESENWRADFTNWVAVSMSERLSLRVSLQLLYDNLPSIGGLPLFDAGGVPTGTVVLTPLDELDSLLTVGLSINF